MILTDTFWRGFELDLAEIKFSYLNWAIGYAREPPQQYRHLFLWPQHRILHRKQPLWSKLRNIPFWPWCSWFTEDFQKTYSAGT